MKKECLVILGCMLFGSQLFAKQAKPPTAPIIVHAADSTKLQLSHNKPAKVKIVDYDCEYTKEFFYTQSWWSSSGAKPSCPENKTVNKIKMRNESKGLDVYTYISLKCCKQKRVWEEKDKA